MSSDLRGGRPSGPPERRAIRRVVTVATASVVAIASTAMIANAGDSDGGPTRAPVTAATIGTPDTVLYGGRISTVDADNSEVQAIAIQDGEILATGANGAIKALAKSGTKLIDLRGRRVTPGLIDGHIHGMREGYHCWTQVVRLDLITKRAEALAMYAAKADELPDDKWIWTTSGGWNLAQLDDPTVFTFTELNAAAPRNPVWVTGTGFTGPRVNQAALDALDLEPGDPGVTLDANGQPTGQLTGSASTLANAAIIAQIDTLGIDGEAKCLADFVAEANSRGLTAWKDAGGNTAPWSTIGAINEGLHVEEGAMALYRTGKLNARIAFNAMSGYAGFARQKQETANALGFLGDDMFRYLGPGEDMMPNDPEYADFTRYSAGRRLSVETHVGQLDPLLTGFEAGNTVHPIADLKWRVAHPTDGQPTDEQLAHGNALGVGWALTFSTVRNGTDGPRFRSTMQSAPHMCLASDAMNVAPWAPFQNLWYVTTGRTLIPGQDGVPADQRLTRTEALRHATAECGWFIDQEDRVGSLEPGKHADLIVLSDDYFTVPEDAIKDIRSNLTMVDGRIVHADGAFAGCDAAAVCGVRDADPAPAPTVPSPTVTVTTTTPTPPAPIKPPSALQLSKRLLTAVAQRMRKLGDVTRSRSVTGTVPAAGQLAVCVFLNTTSSAECLSGKKPSGARSSNLLARGSRTFRAAGTQTISVRSTKAAKARLKGRRSAKVVVLTAFKPAGGGKSVVTKKTLSLKR